MISDSSEDDSKSDGEEPKTPVVVTRTSPYIRYPHDTLRFAIEKAVGTIDGFSLVTAHTPPADFVGLSALAHLVERSMSPGFGQTVVVADWDSQARGRTAAFLGGWPSLRSRARVIEAVIPRRTRNPLFPMVVVDGMQAWSSGMHLTWFLDRYFAIERFHLMALPGGPLAIESQTPKSRYLFSQIQHAENRKELESLVLLSAIERSAWEDAASEERQATVRNLRRAYANIRAKRPNVKLLAAALITERGVLSGLDVNILLA
jgi:hypothetical protein